MCLRIRSISPDQLLFNELQFSLCVQNNVPANHFYRIRETTERRLCTRMLLFLTGSSLHDQCMVIETARVNQIRISSVQFNGLSSSLSFYLIHNYTGHYCFTLLQSRVGGVAICCNRDGMPGLLCWCCCFKQSVLFDEMLMLNDFIPFVSSQ